MDGQACAALSSERIAQALDGEPDVEIPCATVMLKADASLTAAELDAFLADRLARFKIPAHFFFQHDQLPRIASGKIAKKQLREETLVRLATD